MAQARLISASLRNAPYVTFAQADESFTKVSLGVRHVYASVPQVAASHSPIFQTPESVTNTERKRVTPRHRLQQEPDAFWTSVRSAYTSCQLNDNFMQDQRQCDLMRPTWSYLVSSIPCTCRQNRSILPQQRFVRCAPMTKNPDRPFGRKEEINES